jgi:hypothetical protein
LFCPPYNGTLSVYFSGNGRPRGCFSVGTATTEAVEAPLIREALLRSVNGLGGAGCEARLRTARDEG